MENISPLSTLPTSENNTDSNTISPLFDNDLTFTGATQNTAVVVGLSIVFGVIILLTIGGNILVCLSPVVSAKLRTVTYNFLVSLAVADLLLGITVLPFSAISALTTEWWFGVVFCNIYISCDVLFSTASILHLLVISLDRYIAITRPYAYRSNMNHRKAGAVITFVWVVAFCVSFLPIHIGWNTPSGQIQNYDKPGQCLFTWNTSYNLFDGILLFFVPLCLMCAFYVRIVLIANRQAKAIQKLMVNPNRKDSNSNNHYNQVDEHKAIKIIAIVMGCFVVCWVPYFTMFTFSIVCGWQISDFCYQVALWLGYTNSLVNPLIYGLLNREFRGAFRTLLSCCCGGSPRNWGGDSTHQTRPIEMSERNTLNGKVAVYRSGIAAPDGTRRSSNSSHNSRKPSDVYLQLVKSTIVKTN